MSINAKYTIGAVVINGSTQINQIISQNVNAGFEYFTNYGSGEVEPTFQAIRRQAPMFDVSTHAIARALTIPLLSGLNLTGLDLFMRQKDFGATLKTGSTSIKAAATRGCAYIAGINCDHNGEAVAQIMAALVSTDGATRPMAITSGQAMPSLLATDQKYTTGPVTLDDAEIGAIKRVSINPGIQLDVDDASGEVYPTWANLQQTEPTISVDLLDIDKAIVANLDQHGAITDPFKVYLRKIAKGGTRVANNVSEHICFTMQAGLYAIEEISGQDRGDANLRITFRPSKDGATPAIATSTTSTIVTA